MRETDDEYHKPIKFSIERVLMWLRWMAQGGPPRTYWKHDPGWGCHECDNA